MTTTGAGATGATAGASPTGYELGRLINRGGSGSVHEARQLSTGRTVALKLLDVAVSGPEVHRRFDREVVAMRELADHPHIVSLVDAGIHDDRPWLAMAYCPGGSLADLGRVMAPVEAVAVLHAVASALAAAHERQVLHCDVKPQNVLVTGYGQPALADFGIARLTLESQGSRIGGYTLDHVPPEVLRGERPSDRGDVWSLGTTLWQLLAGRPPFRHRDDHAAPAVMQRIDRAPLPPLGRRDLPPGLEPLLVGMTAKNPGDRPSAADVVERVAALARYANLPVDVALPVPPRTTTPSVPPPAPSAGPLSATSTVLGPVPTGPPIAAQPAAGPAGSVPDVAQEATSRARRSTRTPEEKARRRRRRTMIVGALVVLVLISLAGGAYLGWRYLPPREGATTAPVIAAPSSPAPVGGEPASVAPASPTQPRIALTLDCSLKTPTTCEGEGFTQQYRSEVTTLAGDVLYDGCFDYMTLTGPTGVLQQDSFPCNTERPIYLNANRTLPDGEYRIDERVETQDGQRANATLVFSVRS